MSESEAREETKRLARPKVPSWVMMFGLVALVFLTEFGWTLIIKGIKAMNRPDAPDSLTAWRNFVLPYIAIAIAVTVTSYFSFRSHHWNGIVSACLGWLVLCGLAFAAVY